MSKKIILTDADGVLLNWCESFDDWMIRVHEHEKVKGGDYQYNIGHRFNISRKRGFELATEFNNSTEILAIRPLRDAVEYVTKLHQEGYVFHVITSLSDQPLAKEFRRLNLETIFGKGVFTRLVCLETGAGKEETLAEYAGSGLFWIEDMISNADAGRDQGLRPILVDHYYNRSKDTLYYPRVKNWREIYEIIKKS